MKIMNGYWTKNGGDCRISTDEMNRIVLSGDRNIAVLDGPSRCGKTYIAKSIADVKVKIVSAEQLREGFGEYLIDKHKNARDYAESFAGYDLVCFEDADFFLAGKEATQIEFASIVKCIAEFAKVIITGIGLPERAKVLFKYTEGLVDTYTFTETGE